ncbi:hypothetical protein BDV30DRAFT_210437, partial [Aspergillus minisclerotigenes]
MRPESLQTITIWNSRRGVTSWPASRWSFISITRSLFNSLSWPLGRRLLFIYLSVTTTKRPWLAVLIALSGTHSIVSDISLSLPFVSLRSSM